MRVLVVEDDRSLGAFLRSGLELEGHCVELVEDGETALMQVSASHPDLVLLDLSLPKRDGLEVLGQMRARNDDAAVLVVSGRSELNARVECLDMGADDYLLKPFSFSELRARCRALLRRRQQFATPVLRHGDLELNRMEHKVMLGGRTISLTAKEFALLEYLLLHPGECVSRSQLLTNAWHMPEETGTNVVDVYVNYVRRKLDDAGLDALGLAGCGGAIETVRGSGYKLGRLAGDPGKRTAAQMTAVRPMAYA